MALIAVVVFSGCSSPFDDTPYGNWREHDPAEWRLGRTGATHGRATLRTGLDADGPGAAEDASGLGPDASPDAYVRLALERNPSIRAAEHRIERLGARVPQVTSLDDPMLQVAPFGEMAETAAGQVGLMSGISQKLPYPGKLDTRGRIAEQDVAMAMAELQQTRLRIAAETRRAYWSHYFTTRALETTRESRQLLDQFRQIAEAEYKAGNRSQPDVLRASVELSNVDNELIVLEQRRATARGMLNQLLDRPVDATLPEPTIVEPDRLDADLDALLRAAALHNPALQKVHERIEQHRRQRELARLNRRPDLTVSATYNLVDDEGLAMSANGDDQWWFGFGVNLPIWAEKLDAAEREAWRGLMEGVADLTAERNRIAYSVQEAYLRFEAQQKLVALFRDVIVPQAKQTVEASASGYRAGSVDFLTLIDNWRKRVNFDLMHHRAVADMQQALADLEREVGEQVHQSATATDHTPPMREDATTVTPPQAGKESDR
jgi:outer membrane protein TolC